MSDYFQRGVPVPKAEVRRVRRVVPAHKATSSAGHLGFSSLAVERRHVLTLVLLASGCKKGVAPHVPLMSPMLVGVGHKAAWCVQGEVERAPIAASGKRGARRYHQGSEDHHEGRYG